ncbi:MAG: hypothetical protein C0603_00155 [Denitrovibrio sp.]|mgnify:CR=1 FL=1|nr:MAG: hypothetical protein C0603_00155 [Denitrovibrio sp.]
MNKFDAQEFSDRVLNLISTKFSLSKIKNNFTELMEAVFVLSEAEVTLHITDEELAQMDCKEGCSTCCKVNVSILDFEAIIISDFLLKTLTNSELETLKIKMKLLVRDIQSLDEDERIMSNKPCAFLNKKGGCSIYPVRPLLCRSVTSADKQACKDAMTMIALGEEISIPMHARQKQIMDVTFKAVAKSMENQGLSSKSMELTKSVLTHL